jgi:hypothetical protein
MVESVALEQASIQSMTSLRWVTIAQLPLSRHQVRVSEKIGVIPDKTMLPSSDDLLAKRDPVLAYAMEAAGVKISPEEAAKIFPPETPAR